MLTTTQVTIKTTVRVFLREDGHGLAGATVELYRRSGGRARPEQIGRGKTATDGTARFPITFERNGRRGAASARAEIDLDVVLCDAAGKPVYRTRRSVQPRRDAVRLSVPLRRWQARRLGVVQDKPKRSFDGRKQAWCAWWSAQHAKRPKETVTSLCLTRTVLDAVAGLHQPSNALQKMTAERLKRQVDASHLKRIAKHARAGVKAMDACDLPVDVKCTAADSDGRFKDFVQRTFFAPDGEGHGLIQSFKSSAPDPAANLGDPEAGAPFTASAVFTKTCSAQYENGDLAGPGADDMEQYFPDAQVLVPPSVNRIEVWDPETANNVRIGRVRDKELTVQDRDVREGWRTRTIELDVELDDPACLVLEDDGAGRQAFVVDVRPGQKVRLMGAGFINEKARVHVDVRDWRDVNEHGALLIEDDVLPVPGFEGTELDVHGAGADPQPDETPATYNKDEIVFTWPQAAEREGLYRLRLAFENETGTFSELVQDPDDCTISVNEDPVLTVPLYFAVLPPVSARRTRLVATEVHCDDETDPEAMIINLADDVLYEVTGSMSRFRIEDATGEPVDETEPPVQATGSRLFWDAPDTWMAGLEAFPGADGALAFLRMDEMLVASANAFEVDGELDRALVHAALFVVLVVVVLLLIAIIAGAVIALIAAGVLTVGSGGTAVPTIGIVATVATFLTGAVFTAGLAAIELIVASVGGAELIGQAMTLYTGSEIAHRLSPIGFHRVLWVHERPDEGTTVTNTERIEAEEEDGDFREVYRADALGGSYRFELVAQTV